MIKDGSPDKLDITHASGFYGSGKSSREKKFWWADCPTWRKEGRGRSKIAPMQNSASTASDVREEPFCDGAPSLGVSCAGGGDGSPCASHGAGTHSIESKKWQENAEHIAQDIWGCSAFMLSKWDSYCRVDLGSPSQNFFRAPPARSAGKPMEHSYRYRLRFGGPIWLPKLPSIFPRDFKNFQAFFHRFFV